MWPTQAMCACLSFLYVVVFVFVCLFFPSFYFSSSLAFFFVLVHISSFFFLTLSGLNSGILIREGPQTQLWTHVFCFCVYRSIQIDYRPRFFLGGVSFRLQIQNRAARRINFHYRKRSLEFQQKISRYRYRFSLEFQLIYITDTDFRLKTN